MKTFPIFLLTALCWSTGCTMTGSGPAMAKRRTVTPIEAAALNTDALVLSRTSTWHSRDGSHEVNLPPGVYPLEAQDDRYLYFAAPGAILYVVREEPGRGIDLDFRFDFGPDAEDRRKAETGLEEVTRMAEPGGIFLSKTGSREAGAYMTVTREEKLLTFKLPPAFLAQEGRSWRRGLR